jgi:hypothetical protein
MAPDAVDLAGGEGGELAGHDDGRAQARLLVEPRGDLPVVDGGCQGHRRVRVVQAVDGVQAVEHGVLGGRGVQHLRPEQIEAGTGGSTVGLAPWPGGDGRLGRVVGIGRPLEERVGDVLDPVVRQVREQRRGRGYLVVDIRVDHRQAGSPAPDCSVGASGWSEPCTRSGMSVAEQRAAWAHARRHRRARAFELAVALLTLATGGLTLLAVLVPYFAVDLTVERAIQAPRAPWLDALATAVSWLGFPPQSNVVFGAIILVLFLSGRRWQAAGALFAAAGSAGLWFLVAPLVHRARPGAGAGGDADPVRQFPERPRAQLHRHLRVPRVPGLAREAAGGDRPLPAAATGHRHVASLPG